MPQKKTTIGWVLGQRDDTLHGACCPEKMLPYPQGQGLNVHFNTVVYRSNPNETSSIKHLAKLVRAKLNECKVQGFKGSCIQHPPRFSPQKFLLIILMQP